MPFVISLCDLYLIEEAQERNGGGEMDEEKEEQRRARVDAAACRASAHDNNPSIVAWKNGKQNGNGNCNWCRQTVSMMILNAKK